MRFKVKFCEREMRFPVRFSEQLNISDQGYDAGYNAGYNKGKEEGYETGYNAGYETGRKLGYSAGYNDGYEKGLAARTYETWTISLTDGSVVEKEVALL